MDANNNQIDTLIENLFLALHRMKSKQLVIKNLQHFVGMLSGIQQILEYHTCRDFYKRGRAGELVQKVKSMDLAKLRTIQLDQNLIKQLVDVEKCFKSHLNTKSRNFYFAKLRATLSEIGYRKFKAAILDLYDDESTQEDILELWNMQYSILKGLMHDLTLARYMESRKRALPTSLTYQDIIEFTRKTMLKSRWTFQLPSPEACKKGGLFKTISHAYTSSIKPYNSNVAGPF